MDRRNLDLLNERVPEFHEPTTPEEYASVASGSTIGPGGPVRHSTFPMVQAPSTRPVGMRGTSPDGSDDVEMNMRAVYEQEDEELEALADKLVGKRSTRPRALKRFETA